MYTIVQSYLLGLVVAELLRSIDAQTGIQRYPLLADVRYGLLCWDRWFPRFLHLLVPQMDAQQ